MLLGPPRVERDGATVAFDTRKAVALLAVLALADRPRPRDVLAELLWPEHDAEHARGALRRTLSALRSAVGADFVDATRDSVSLVRSAGLRVDVDAFRGAAVEGRAGDAAGVFRGDFLEGFGLRDAPAFEDWQRAEADGLRRELALGAGAARRGDGRPGDGASLARARPAARARAPRADPALRRARRPRRGARPVPRVRAHAVARAGGAAARGDDAAVRGDQRGHARGARRPAGGGDRGSAARAAGRAGARVGGAARRLRRHRGRRARRAARGRGGDRQDAAGRGAGGGLEDARRGGAGRARLRGGGSARVRPAGRGAARRGCARTTRGWRRWASARSARRRGCWAI